MKTVVVWGSTRTHHIAFNNIIKQNSWLRKILGLIKFPSDFPYIRLYGLRIPIIYNKRFTLEIIGHRILLTPKNTYGFFNRARNVNLNVTDPIVLKDVVSKGWYKNPKPYMKAVNIDWIELKYYNKGKEEAILLCAEGVFMGSITSKTNLIFNAIRVSKTDY